MSVAAQALFALAAIGAIVVGVLLYYHKQTLSVWVTFISIMAVTLAFCLQWQEGIWKKEEELVQAQKATTSESKFSDKGKFFSASQKAAFLAASWDGPFLFLYHTQDGQAMAPIGLAINVEVTNNRQTLTKIKSYVADIGTGNNQWTRIYSIPQLTDDSVYFATENDITRCWRVTFNPGMFDLRVKNKTLQPGESVDGWMIFEYPRQLQVPATAELRLRLENSQSEVEEATFRILPEPGKSGQNSIGTSGIARVGNAPEINFGSVPLSPFHQK